MDEQHPLEGYPSIHCTIMYLETPGHLWLSSLYGSYRFHCDIEIPADTEVDFFCPSCEELISDGPLCDACESNTVILEMGAGGSVRFCARYHCPKHSIAFGDSESITVASIMSRYVYTLYDTDDLISAAELIIDNEIRTIPILDHANQRLIGIITDQVILNTIYPKEFTDDPDETIPAGTIEEWKNMTCGRIALTKFPHLSPDQSLMEAYRAMMAARECAMIVLKKGTLVGMLNITDLYRALIREKIG